MKDGENQGYQRKVKDIKINSDLFAIIPEGLTVVKPDQFALLARSAYSFEYDESGQMVAMKGGQIMKDKLEKPIPVREILTDFAAQTNWIPAGGRGGANEEGKKSQQFEALTAVYGNMETHKINQMSA